MPSYQVAIAGATGNLGTPILGAVLEAGHQVTALSRIGGNTKTISAFYSLNTVTLFM